MSLMCLHCFVGKPCCNIPVSDTSGIPDDLALDLLTTRADNAHNRLDQSCLSKCITEPGHKGAISTAAQ